MKRLVLDASVAVKWFHEEEYTPEALMLREANDRGLCEFLSPVLIVYEFSNALKKPPNLFSEKEVTDAMNSVFSRLTEIVTPNQMDIDEVIKTAFKYNITAYDASYVALATDRKTVMVTGDKWLASKVKNERIAIFLGSGNYKEFIQQIIKAGQ